MARHISIFRSPDAAFAAFDALRTEGYTEDQLTLLAPSASSGELPPGPPSSEPPPPGACGVKTGDVAGSILGWAGGMAGAAATLAFLPAVGPIAMVGTVMLSSIFGATIGGVVGRAVQQSAAPEFPHDYAFIYEDALRR